VTGSGCSGRPGGHPSMAPDGGVTVTGELGDDLWWALTVCRLSLRDLLEAAP
jgi:hypothetical protein